MEGRQPHRRGESLTSRQWRVSGAAAGLLLALIVGVGARAVRTSGAHGASGHGCVNVVVPGATGVGIPHRCGALARTLCRTAAARQDRVAWLTRAECRKAGVGAAPAAP